MEKWQKDKEKDAWKENIVFAVKYGLEHSNVIIILSDFPDCLVF